jgi:hypothetical protein
MPGNLMHTVRPPPLGHAECNYTKHQTGQASRTGPVRRTNKMAKEPYTKEFCNFQQWAMSLACLARESGPG